MSHQPDWEVYFCQIEEMPALIGVDLELRKIAPLPDKTSVAELTVYLTTPQEDGFPAEEEWEPLGDIEDAVVDAMEGAKQAIFSGKTMNKGARKFYFYSEAPALQEIALAQVMAGFPEYQFEYTFWEDEEWETYFDFLFPEPEDYQKITNSKVLRQLEENGDVPEMPRQIDHWIFFDNEQTMQAYTDKVLEKGFKVEESIIEEELEHKPYKLQISRVDKADEETINEVVIDLWRLAQEFNGDYDGWEAFIMRGK